MVLGEGVRYKGKTQRRASRAVALAEFKQDWELLRSICAPTIQWLYSSLDAAFVDKQMTAEEYVAEMSAPHGLGDSRCEENLPKQTRSWQLLTFCSEYTTSFGWCGV